MYIPLGICVHLLIYFPDGAHNTSHTLFASYLLQEEVLEERDDRFIPVQAPLFSIQLFSPVNWQVGSIWLL